MARTEARIFTSIWNDDDFLALPPGPQRLYMFLLSQRELTYCGTMPLRERRWAVKAAGLTLADIERDLKELEGSANPSANPGFRQPFVITDEETGELLIRSLLRRDTAWKQPNLLKQAIESAQEIESPRIRGVLLAELRRLPLEETSSEQVKTLVAEFIEYLEQGSPYPSAYPPDDPESYPPDDPAEYPSADSSDNGRPRARILRTPISGAPTDLSPSAQRQRGTYLPEPFVVTDEMKSWFRQNCSHVDARFEHDKFLDHWRGKPGKEGRKVDWVATWRNWMRTAEQRSMPRRRGPDPRQEATDQLFEDAAARIAARKEITT